MVDYLKYAVIKILNRKGNLRISKSLIPETEVILPKNVFLFDFKDGRNYFLSRNRNLMTIIKSDNRATLERTSLLINVPQKKSKCEYFFGIQIEEKTIALKQIKKWQKEIRK